MRSAVVDTTVLISAFLTAGGVAGQVLRQAYQGAFTLCLAREIIEETSSRLLRRRNIRRSYHYADERVHRYCRDLETVARLVGDLPEVHAVERDPNDDMIIACALEARADYIVTRDKDLLTLGTYEKIRMVTPEVFMDILRQKPDRPGSPMESK